MASPRAPRWLACALLLFGACLDTVREPDCLRDGLCECKTKADCPTGKDCVDGRCFEVPDAGLAGDLGWPCAADDECLFGPCLPRGPGNGAVCSAWCGADGGFSCDKGWQCKQGRGAGEFLCAPPLEALCLACQVDGDCNVAGDRCLDIGGQRFCGSDCSLGGACPEGYSCRSLLVDAGTARQCVPDTNTCECSLVSAGLRRSCRRGNALGTCYGFETCQPNASWSGCDAREATVEVCDGEDNDCDGLVDQADPDLVTSGLPGYPDCVKGLTCTGKWGCGPLADGGTGFSCSAPDPREEVCNGADDDCDGLIDEGLLDSQGHYSSVRACGSCATDCLVTLSGLERQGGAVRADAAACEVRGGQYTCVPLRCEKGSYPSPAQAPQVCEPAVTSQCRPCTTASDCVVPGDECVAVGSDTGKACAQSCGEDAVYAGCTGRLGEQGCCPADSACELVGGRKLCVPAGDSCQCTPARVGFERSCVVTSGADTCVGRQTCDAQGSFGVCDTSATAVEFCDGRDNDCDGVVDNGFINTRGTGTYDTDGHCGACNNDCGAKWSPTIQHAIGGCVTGSAQPGCAIVACTSETVPGGGACRVDAECGQGRTCHPTYRQCVKGCGGPSDCGAGQTCENGFCALGCTTDQQCVSALGAPSTCAAGRCAVTYQFVNVDKEDTNGCECAAQSTTDEPDLSAAWPTPGLPYVDRNCDGVDGVAATSLYVWAQSTSSLGTRAAPYRTISEALSAFRVGVHSAILVAQGTYVEQVVLKNGASVHGGYAPGFAARDVIQYPTLIEAAEPSATGPRGTVNASGLSSRTVVAGFTIRGYDVISRPAPGQPARNSYAVYVKNSPGLVLQNDHLVGGRGGDGTPAEAGVAGSNGGVGQGGRDARECNSPNCTGESQAGGAAGANAACGGTQGNPGAGASLTRSPQDYQTSAGGNGRGGTNSTYQHSDSTQSAYCKYDCVIGGSNPAGGAAQNGSDGRANTAGSGCAASMGAVVGDDWVAASGAAGRTGTNGLGGGGGGAGGCVNNVNPATCSVGRRVGDLGGTGGGGGAGGCGGGAGAGAGSGGGSFAVFVIGASPTIVGNLIDLGFGGHGGPGGAGGYGGLGGAGGRGGSNTQLAWCAGQGGPGGRGGNGGAGSGGGGGCGGSVFGIAGQGIGTAPQSLNTFAASPVNAQGHGGPGGASPAGDGFRGGSGQAGVVVQVKSF